MLGHGDEGQGVVCFVVEGGEGAAGAEGVPDPEREEEGQGGFAGEGGGEPDGFWRLPAGADERAFGGGGAEGSFGKADLRDCHDQLEMGGSAGSFYIGTGNEPGNGYGGFSCLPVDRNLVGLLKDLCQGCRAVELKAGE